MVGFVNTENNDDRGDKAAVGELVSTLKFCWSTDGQRDHRQEGETGTGEAAMNLQHK